MSIDILKEQIKSNSIKNLYLFYGQEEYLKKVYLESIENKIIRADMKTMNKIVIEGKLDMRKLADSCDTAPLFSEKKIVIVKNSGIFKSGKKGETEKSGSQKDSLLLYLKSIPSYTCLVFVEEEIDKRLKTVDFIKKNGLIVEFPFQKPAELVKWVIKVFKSSNKEISQELAAVLVNNSEQGMNELLSEVNKLILFLGEREKILLEDIQKVCTKSIKSRIFDLTDAIAEKNRTKAFIILQEMTVLKEPMPKILFMITRQFNQILEMKLLNQAGMSLNDSAGKLGVPPFIAGKILKQSKEFELEVLQKAIVDSLEMDVAIKTGRINDRMAVEMLLAGLKG
ncbi:MAG: DNA polymerase III subunit delta [Bacillota bacterium]|nr:DNA polymerase III subunit delta [Bacillota bacterium]